MPRKIKAPQRLAHLPQVVLAFLEKQVDGDWDRVLLENGSPVVVNRAMPATQRVIRELDEPAPVQKAPVRRVPPEEMTRVELPPDKRTRRKLIEHGVVPGLNLQVTAAPPPPAPPEPEPVPEPVTEPVAEPETPPEREPMPEWVSTPRAPLRAAGPAAPSIAALVSDPGDVEAARAALAELDRRMGRRTAEEMAEPDPTTLAQPSPNGNTPPPKAPLPAPPVFRPPVITTTPRRAAPEPVETLPAPVKAAVTQAREKTAIVVPKHPRYMRKTLQLLGAVVGSEDEQGFVGVTFRGEYLGQIQMRNYRTPKAKSDWKRVLEEISRR